MLTKRYQVTCDQQGCTNRYLGWGLKGGFKAELRGAGWKTTWSFWGATHTCPSCCAGVHPEFQEDR